MSSQKDSNKKPDSVSKDTTTNQSIILGICSHCGKTSLFYNTTNKKHECLNLECASNKRDIFNKVIWPKSTPTIQENEEHETKIQEELSNPLLLGVKMFLADIRSWRRQYREGEYVCADFAKEAYDAATERGIRCGYVVISFTNSNIGHAIIAFETDHGLKYFEPQSGNEEDVIVGRHYSGQLEGVPEDNVICEIEITWNDGTRTRIDR